MTDKTIDKVLAQLKTLYPHRNFGVGFSSIENSIVIKADAETDLDKNDLDLLCKICRGKVFENKLVKRGKPYKDEVRTIKIQLYYGTIIK